MSWSSPSQQLCWMRIQQNKPTHPMCLLPATSLFISSQGSLLPDPSTPVSPVCICCVIYLKKRKTQPLRAMFPTFFPCRLLSDGSWPDGPLAWAQELPVMLLTIASSVLLWRLSSPNTAVVKGIQSSQTCKETPWWGCVCVGRFEPR